MIFRISCFMLAGVLMVACQEKSTLPAITPDVITEKTPNDTDDPAIWVHPKDPSKSVVFGTDKETNGGVYAFDLEGKIIDSLSIKNIQRPNNVDLAYGFKLNDSTRTDVLVFTEREKQQIRMFAIPSMKPIDKGGFKVFVNETTPEYNLPMGVALYNTGSELYAVVGRKAGPETGYLYQYELVSDGTQIVSNLVRKFGSFSGKKEIEAIAVDNELGLVYYSDEKHCIRKYYADPTKGNEELACFGGEYFLRDIEGIAVAKTGENTGYLIVSDQQKGQFNLFDRKTNEFIKAINLSTLETDGIDVVTIPLNDTFNSGLFVAMNDSKEFYFYNFNKLLE